MGPLASWGESGSGLSTSRSRSHDGRAKVTRSYANVSTFNSHDETSRIVFAVKRVAMFKGTCKR